MFFHKWKKKTEHFGDFTNYLKHSSRLIWLISILGSWSPKSSDPSGRYFQHLYDICRDSNDGGSACVKPLDVSPLPRTLATAVCAHYFNVPLYQLVDN